MTKKDTWDQRHRQARSVSLDADPFLKKHIGKLKPGSVYDLACGRGRNSFYLVRHGYRVISIDFSTSAINAVNEVNHQENLDIHTMELDLSQRNSFESLNQADNVLVVNFKLENEILDLIPDLLKDNGVFLYCTFNTRQHHDHNFPLKYCLQPEELIGKSWDLKLMHYASFDQNGHRDAYLFKKHP